jgi:hypothetical protein
VAELQDAVLGLAQPPRSGRDRMILENLFEIKENISSMGEDGFYVACISART